MCLFDYYHQIRGYEGDTRGGRGRRGRRCRAEFTAGRQELLRSAAAPGAEPLPSSCLTELFGLLSPKWWRSRELPTPSAPSIILYPDLRVQPHRHPRPQAHAQSPSFYFHRELFPSSRHYSHSDPNPMLHTASSPSLYSSPFPSSNS